MVRAPFFFCSCRGAEGAEIGKRVWNTNLR